MDKLTDIRGLEEDPSGWDVLFVGGDGHSVSHRGPESPSADSASGAAGGSALLPRPRPPSPSEQVSPFRTLPPPILWKPKGTRAL